MNFYHTASGADPLRPEGILSLDDIRAKVGEANQKPARRDALSAFRVIAERGHIDLASVPASASGVRRLGAAHPGERDQERAEVALPIARRGRWTDPDLCRTGPPELYAGARLRHALDDLRRLSHGCALDLLSDRPRHEASLRPGRQSAPVSCGSGHDPGRSRAGSSPLGLCPARTPLLSHNRTLLCPRRPDRSEPQGSCCPG